MGKQVNTETILIYPCEFGKLNKVDIDYTFEKAIADKNGIRNYLFNYDEYITLDKGLKLNKEDKEPEEINAVYRGWMLNAEQYDKLYNDLVDKYNIRLVNTPEEYEHAPYFNNAYYKLADYTPKVAIFNKDEVCEIDWDEIKGYFKRFIIKDFVKSVKGWEFPEYFDCTYTNEQLSKYLNKFIELRGDLYTGGIIFKEYVELDRTNGNTHEFRAFYKNGRIVALYHNSNNYEDDLKQVRKFAEVIPKLDSKFYTIDFAIKNNGDIIIIECGDGQVSGLPSQNEAEQLYENLFKQLNLK